MADLFWKMFKAHVMAKLGAICAATPDNASMEIEGRDVFIA